MVIILFINLFDDKKLMFNHEIFRSDFKLRLIYTIFLNLVRENNINILIKIGFPFPFKRCLRNKRNNRCLLTLIK